MNELQSAKLIIDQKGQCYSPRTIYCKNDNCMFWLRRKCTCTSIVERVKLAKERVNQIEEANKRHRKENDMEGLKVKIVIPDMIEKKHIALAQMIMSKNLDGFETVVYDCSDLSKIETLRLVIQDNFIGEIPVSWYQEIEE